jgi:hypothetical protein
MRNSQRHLQVMTGGALACALVLAPRMAVAETFSFTAVFSGASTVCIQCPPGNAFVYGDTSHLPVPTFADGDTLHGIFAYDPNQPSSVAPQSNYAVYTGQLMSLTVPNTTFAFGNPQITVQNGAIGDFPNFSIAAGGLVAAPPGHTFHVDLSLGLETFDGQAFLPPVLPVSFDLTKYPFAFAALTVTDSVGGEEIGSALYRFQVIGIEPQLFFASTSPPAPTPLPGTLSLFATGLALAGLALRRKARQRA